MNTKISKFLMGLLVASSMVFWTSCKPNDTKILEDTKAKVSAIDPNVAVEVHEGVVTLSGQVLDDAVKMEVENAAKEVKGVKSVTNNVVATPPPAPPAPVVINDDAAITTAIQSGLEMKNIKGVTVAVANGEVTLTGNARKNDLQTIMQVANESKPAKVINNLVIK
jgi:osmotically-inducible protein OsmY